MSGIKVDVSALHAGLTENRKDYETIFSQKLVNGFAAKNDMVSLPVVQKVTLVREELGPVSQPGRTGEINNPNHTLWTYKERTAELKPAKADIAIEEVQLNKLAVSFLAKKEPADPRDLHGFAGQRYLMARIIDKIRKEQSAAIIKGQLGYNYDSENKQSLFQGGLNLFDGLGLKFLTGYATSGTGAVGDIPSGNKVTGAASSVSASNILTELGKLQDLIYNNQDLRVAEDEVGGRVWIDPVWYGYALDALDALPYKQDLVVRQENGRLVFKKLRNTEIVKREYMAGVQNMFWSLTDNIFYLHQDTEEDIPTIEIQKVGRGLQILIDWQSNVDYADGRYVALYK